MTVRIRTMSERDLSQRLDQILDLAMLANPWARRSKYKHFLLPLFHKFSHLAFVAVDGKKIVGYVMGDVDGNEGEVEDIAVLPGYRGRTLGRRLMRTELKAMGRLGVRRIILWVSWKNAEAIPFYYRLGFRFLHCVRDRTGPGQDAVYLERKLHPPVQTRPDVKCNQKNKGSMNSLSSFDVARRDRPIHLLQ